MSTENQKNRKKVNLGNIKGVDPTDALRNGQDNPWVSVVKALNPLGHIATAYANTLAYKLEVKRLDVELERIRSQAEILHQAIDANLQIRMEQLQQRRVAMLAFYDSVNQELDRIHIDRMKVLEMIELVTVKTLDAGYSIEERTLFREMATEMVKQLPAFGQSATGSLKTLVKSLPKVEIESILVSGEED